MGALAFATSSCATDSSRAPVVRLVRIEAVGCSAPEIATGFMVAAGFVVTVAHVLDNGKTFTVDGMPATVVSVDDRMDAALLHVANSADRSVEFADPFAPANVRLLRWRSERAQIVDVVVTQVATINFTDLRKHSDVNRSGLLIDHASVPGDSGSPLLNADGRVVGMLFASSVDSTEVGYAVSSMEVRTLLAAPKTVPPHVGSCG